MHYKNIYKNEHMDIQVLMPPKPPTDGGTPPTPQQKGKCLHNIPISPKHTNAQGNQQLSLGVPMKGGTPIQGWYEGSVLTQRGAPYNPPTTFKASQNIQMHRGVWGIWGCTNVQGCINIWGHTNIGGIQTPPKYKKHACH